MWWTRLWLFVLSLALSALLLGVGIVLREPSSPAVGPLPNDPLVEKTQQVAELSLRLAAEQLIEQATILSSDAQLVAGLEERERGLAEPELLRQSLAKRLRKLLGAATDGAAPWAMLIDQGGVVVTRVGLSESWHGDSLIGWPLLQLGLRGYRLDDLYEEDGRVFEVAVAPLSTQSHDRYAGAVVVGRALDDRLGGRLGMTAVWRRSGRALDASAPVPPSGASLIAVARPGSVAGIELVGWLPSGPTGSHQAELLLRIKHALTLKVLLVGLLVFGVLCGIGLLLLGRDLAKIRANSPFSAGLGPFSPGLPYIPLELPAIAPAACVAAPTDLPAESDALGARAASESLARTTEIDEPIGPDLAHMYADFVSAKVRCGESLSGLSFETFCDELQGSRASITRDQGCRTVVFRVHVKDGRALLRATPQW